MSRQSLTRLFSDLKERDHHTPPPDRELGLASSAQADILEQPRNVQVLTLEAYLAPKRPRQTKQREEKREGNCQSSKEDLTSINIPSDAI
jgi:hypothetical protein